MFKNISQKREPGTFCVGFTGFSLQKFFMPAYARVTGRRIDILQAEWIVQGFFTRQWQRRFLIRDHFRRPYREIDCDTEFGPELKYYLPYAYWHYLNGTLRQTRSFKNTNCFYFFSPQHVEKLSQRGYVLDPDIPNSEDHNFTYSFRRWAQVPLKATYRNAINFGFQKPFVVISSKFNREWNGSPINFLSTETLSKIAERLTPHYTVVYNRPGNSLIVADHNDIQELNDKPYLKEYHPQVVLAEDLFDRFRDQVSSFNHFQLCLYAQCERFISVQGGNSVLASYFGGTNLVFQRSGQEIFFNELASIYPRLAGTSCYGFETYDSLLTGVDKYFLNMSGINLTA